MKETVKEYLIELLEEHIEDMECDIANAHLDSSEITQLQNDVDSANYCLDELLKVETFD